MKHFKNEFNVLVPAFLIPGCQHEITQLLAQAVIQMMLEL